MIRILVAMSVAAGSAALGVIFIRRGMQQLGSLENYAPWALISYFWHALCNPYVLVGTALNAVFYFLYLASLSWTEVTVVLPMTAIEYVMAAVLAIAILKENVPPLRWVGIALVIFGVILIARSGGET